MDRINKIYEAFLNSCTEEKKQLIDEFVLDVNKKQKLVYGSEAYENLKKEMAAKYSIDVVLQNNEVLLSFSDERMQFIIKKEIDEKLNADIRFMYKPNEESMFTVGIGDKNSSLDDRVDFGIFYCYEEKNGSVEKKDDCEIKTVFATNKRVKSKKKYEEIETTHSMLMEDVAEYFDDPNLFTEMFLLKYDIVVKDDVALSIIHDTITSLKNKNTVQNKLKI